MGFVGDVIGSVAGGLFGDEPEPSRQESITGLSQLFRELPLARDISTDILERSQGLAGQRDPFFTPLVEQQLAGIDILSDSGVRFQPQFDFGRRASEQFDRAARLFGNVAPTLNLAGQRISQGVDPITGQEVSQTIGFFQNPFEDIVVSNAARDAREAGLGLLSDIGQRATQAGAFGSTRQGVVESIVPERVAQEVGDLSARLRQSGFNAAASNALNLLQSGRSRALQGAGLDISRAGQFAGAGQALAGLGSRLFDARRGVQDIQNQQLRNELALGSSRLQAGDILRSAAQQESAIPLQQLDLLRNVIGGFPTAGATTQVGATPGTAGLFSAGGNVGAGFGNILGSISSQQPFVRESIINDFSSGNIGGGIGNFIGGLF